MRRREVLKVDELDHRQFAMAAKMLADSFSFGADPSPWVGAGTEYVQSRAYQEGDSIKAMDWRLTARTGRFHVRDYEAPKRKAVQIVLDTSASMTLSSTKKSKYGIALQIAAAVALASLDHVRPVGLIGCGSEEVRVTPTLSKSDIFLWSHKMRHYGFMESTRLSEALDNINATPGDQSIVIVLSDLHELDCVRALKHLAPRHETIVIQLQDPAELGRIGGGIYRVREAESHESLTAHGFSHWFGKDEDCTQKQKKDELKKAGIDHLVVRTDQKFAGKLRLFFSNRSILTGRA